MQVPRNDWEPMEEFDTLIVKFQALFTLLSAFCAIFTLSWPFAILAVAGFFALKANMARFEGRYPRATVRSKGFWHI